MRAHVEVRVLGGRVETPKSERRVLLLLHRQRVFWLMVMLLRGHIHTVVLLLLLGLRRGRMRAVVKVGGKLSLDALLHAVELGGLGRKGAQKRRRR